jgi:hypothetical protein
MRIQERNRECGECFACNEAIAAGEGYVAGSPLGGAFSAYACAECVARRATCPFNAVWRLVDYGIGPGEVFERDRFVKEWIDDRRFGDDVRKQGPVSVFDDGRYIDVLDWVGTPLMATALAHYDGLMARFSPESSSVA